jgi:hypothetical protein
VSPFTVAFIHHALTGVVEANRRALRLSPGDPHLNTAFAVLTLLNAGRDTPTIARAVD